MNTEIEMLIRGYFNDDDVAGVKLTTEPDGTIFDHDSNWGFDPAELARRIDALVKVKEAAE